MSEWELMDNDASSGSEWEMMPTNLNTSNSNESQANKMNNGVSSGALGLLGKGATNVSAGLLNSLTGLGRMLPDMAKMVPNELQDALPYKAGERPVDNFDAYKFMGVENKPFYTPTGALQTLGELALPLPAGMKGAEGAKNILKSSGIFSSRKSIANAILNQHDLIEKNAIQGFKDVSKEVLNRGIKKFPVSPEMIEDLRQFFPKTKQVNSLLTDAKKGDFNALRKLQTDLYTKGKKNLRSPLESERMRGEEMFEKREDINKGISKHLKSSGHEDLNDLLNRSRSDFRKLQDVYYNPKMNNAIIDMVDTESRKIPKNLLNILQEESKPMQQLIDFHPGLQNQINRYHTRKNVLKMGKKFLPYGLVGGLGYEAGKRY